MHMVEHDNRSIQGPFAAIPIMKRLQSDGAFLGRKVFTFLTTPGYKIYPSRVLPVGQVSPADFE
jgi:hypothetical protein